MIRILPLLCILLLGTSIRCFAQEDRGRHLYRKVPTAWIDSVRRLDPEGNNASLLLTYESFIEPDTLTGDDGYSMGGGILKAQFVNLDDDPAEELAGIFAWSENYPTMAVFKEFEGAWFLLYAEPYYLFYHSPELLVADDGTAHKTFYYRELYQRGTGVYEDAYLFYKLIDNKVYRCLELINEARIYGWELSLNQDAATKFRFLKDDGLSVTYQYSFSPFAIYDKGFRQEIPAKLTFVKGNENVRYTWDSLTRTYRPRFSTTPGALNTEKISCLNAFGNDTLFIRAFAYEIRKTPTTGKPEQKRLLRLYLDNVRDPPAADSSGQLEEKAQIGDLRFYGPPEKK